MRIFTLVLLLGTPALANDNTQPEPQPMRYRGIEKLLKQNLEKVKRTAERERADETRTRT